ncbi:hypothetical protein BB560_002361 [Smittium megazygosporum]|uniref:Rhodanese domain-containing protein n=1 Tax=Smittium megazygosporum TaxID=133381 RepID=A0A2T9ZF21_9FUNG|nr:hypothetical protein BB560_005965 [Smittium megazygosporum]PVV03171.1 hypothetical protein BB560_002361 [Smittium megazygosporum]
MESQQPAQALPQHAKPFEYSQLEQKLASNLEDTVLIDVRTPEQFEAGHIPGAVNLEYAQFQDALTLSREDFVKKYGFEIPSASSDKEIVLYCGSGTRCKKSAVIAEAAGYKDNLSIYYKGYKEYKTLTNQQQ